MKTEEVSEGLGSALPGEEVDEEGAPSVPRSRRCSSEDISLTTASLGRRLTNSQTHKITKPENQKMCFIALSQRKGRVGRQESKYELQELRRIFWVMVKSICREK